MAIETRRGRAAFHYLCLKANGRSQRRYVGTTSNPVADVVVRSDRLAQAYGLAHRQAAAEELQAYDRLEPCLRLLATRVTSCVDRYRQRVQRAGRSRARSWTQHCEAQMINPASQSAHVAITREEFDELVFRAAGGNEEAVTDLREALRANPACYQLLGDLARHIQVCLVKLVTRDVIVAREALNLKIDELRESLLGADPSPLERLIVGEILASWLDLSFQRISHSQEPPTETIAKRREQRLERAQKRHLKAVATLNEIQRG